MPSNPFTIVGFTVAEFYGRGDPYFGGTADDRPLGTAGTFLDGCYHLGEVARFDTRDAAQQAADAAPQRSGGKVGIIPIREWAAS